MNFIKAILNRPSVIIVLFAILTLGGLISYRLLSYELMPDFAVPVVTVTTIYPGAAPGEVENEVTRRIEDAVSGLDNLDDLISKSLESASVVIIQFKSGTDIDRALDEAQREINKILGDLPDDAKSPSLSKYSPSDQPIIQLVATSNMPGGVFYKEVEDKLLPKLQQVKGVAEITMVGGEEREIRVDVNNQKLNYYGLSPLQVSAAIAQGNMDFPTGSVKSNTENMTLRLAGKFTDMEQIEEVAVAVGANGSIVRVKDVATVTDGLADASSISRYNGVNGIGLFVKKQPDGNAVAISQELQKKIAEIEETYQAQHVRFTIAYDSSDFTLAAVDAVVHDLLLAVLMVAVIMLLFLHSFRNAFIVMISVPASLVSALLFMYVMGYSLNLMTLLGLSLVIGILVDDSIVVLENVQRHMEMGKDRWQATIDGVSEIGFAVVAITLVIVVVFVPITMVNSIIADLLRQFSLTVAFSTLVSLLASFLLTPWLTSRIGKLEHLNPRNPFQAFLIWFEKQLTGLTNWYTGAVTWVLGHKLIFSGVVIGMFAATMWVMGLGIVGQEFVSQGDQGKFMLSLKYDKGISLDKNNLRSLEIEQDLLARSEVKGIIANVGGASTGMSSTGQGEVNRTELTVELQELRERPDQLTTEQYMIRTRDYVMATYPGIEVTTTIVSSAGGGSAPIEFLITGDNLQTILATANSMADSLRKMPGSNDVKVSVEDGNPEVQVRIDREKMAQLGLNIQTVGATLQNAFSGNDDSKFREDGLEYDIRVMLDAFDRKNPEDVKAITFVSPIAGRAVRLEEFADVSLGQGPSLLERKDRRTSVTVTSNVLGVSSGALMTQLNTLTANYDFPEGVEFTWGGMAKSQTDGFASLGLAMLIALMLVYFIMVLLYDNFVYPFVVLFSVPVAVIGSLLALALSASNFSIFAMLGMIMLIGLVIKNAILIVDFANQLKARGMHYKEAIITAGQDRLRPILMTTIAMVIGMTPIAVASGAGSEWKNSLGWVLIGGLISSMLLTVFVVPMMNYIVDRIAEKLSKKKIVQPEEELVAP